MLAPPTIAADSRDSIRARLLALAAPLVLLGGALLSQYVGGLYPCEMCWWQRYAHGAALVLAALAFTAPAPNPRARTLTALAALGIAVSGAIGAFHAGVEYRWWEGLTRCTATGAGSLGDIMSIPLVRCDQAQWTFHGVSLAGFNAILSLGAAVVIAALLRRARSDAR